MENRDLYVNAVDFLELLDCLRARTTNKNELAAYDAVEEIVMDSPWKEVKDE